MACDDFLRRVVAVRCGRGRVLDLRSWWSRLGFGSCCGIRQSSACGSAAYRGLDHLPAAVSSACCCGCIHRCTRFVLFGYVGAGTAGRSLVSRPNFRTPDNDACGWVASALGRWVSSILYVHLSVLAFTALLPTHPAHRCPSALWRNSNSPKRLTMRCSELPASVTVAAWAACRAVPPPSLSFSRQAQLTHIVWKFEPRHRAGARIREKDSRGGSDLDPGLSLLTAL